MVRRPPEQAVEAAYMMSDMDVKIGDDTQGGCIPVCYVLAGVLNKLGIPAKVIETKVIVKPFGDARYSEISSDNPDGFLGHTVVYLPTKHWIIDASLQTQKSAVIPVAMPNGGPVFIDFNHNEHTVAEAELDRGVANYFEFKLNGTTWRNSSMPWKGLDQVIKVIVESINEEGGKVYG